MQTGLPGKGRDQIIDVSLFWQAQINPHPNSSDVRGGRRLFLATLILAVGSPSSGSYPADNAAPCKIRHWRFCCAYESPLFWKPATYLLVLYGIGRSSMISSSFIRNGIGHGVALGDHVCFLLLLLGKENVQWQLPASTRHSPDRPKWVNRFRLRFSKLGPQLLYFQCALYWWNSTDPALWKWRLPNPCSCKIIVWYWFSSLWGLRYYRCRLPVSVDRNDMGFYHIFSPWFIKMDFCTIRPLFCE